MNTLTPSTTSRAAVIQAAVASSPLGLTRRELGFPSVIALNQMVQEGSLVRVGNHRYGIPGLHQSVARLPRATRSLRTHRVGRTTRPARTRSAR